MHVAIPSMRISVHVCLKALYHTYNLSFLISVGFSRQTFLNASMEIACRPLSKHVGTNFPVDWVSLCSPWGSSAWVFPKSDCLAFSCRMVNSLWLFFLNCLAFWYIRASSACWETLRLNEATVDGKWPLFRTLLDKRVFRDTGAKQSFRLTQLQGQDSESLCSYLQGWMKRRFAARAWEPYPFFSKHGNNLVRRHSLLECPYIKISEKHVYCTLKDTYSMQLS